MGTYLDHKPWEHFLMFVITSAFGFIGAEVVKLPQGYKCPCFWRKLPNCLGPIKIPPLIGSIFFGLLAWYMSKWGYETYNENWAAYARNIPLLIALTRGGLEVYFWKVSYISVFFATVPFIANSIIIGVLTSLELGLPWLLGILTGLMLNAVSPTVIVILML